jgi:hypothetical protein
MDALHIINKVPLPRKSITRDASLTIFKSAKEGFLPVLVHSMGLTFMANEAGSRRETCVLTGMDFARVWLEMRIDKFTTSFS